MKRSNFDHLGRTAADVQAEMFDWFLDIRAGGGGLKGCLLRKMFVVKCKDVYGEWLQQQNPPIPVEGQLGNIWLDGWINEYNVRKPNKRTLKIKDIST